MTDPQPKCKIVDINTQETLAFYLDIPGEDGIWAFPGEGFFIPEFIDHSVAATWVMSEGKITGRLAT